MLGFSRKQDGHYRHVKKLEMEKGLAEKEAEKAAIAAVYNKRAGNVQTLL